MKQDYTHITVVLDKSGSMGTVAEETISGFNKFLQDQKLVKGEATISLYQFNGKVDKLIEFKAIETAEPLTSATYLPSGGTALYDAIMTAIKETGETLASCSVDKRPAKVIFAIITDGQENSSKSATQKVVADAIKHQTEIYSWSFVFIGANQDAIMVGKELNISSERSLTYTGGKIGTQQVFASLSLNSVFYRSGQDRAFSFKPEDREAQSVAETVDLK